MLESGKREAQKTWDASPTGSTSAPGEAPGTAAFFEAARRFRDHEEQPWLPEVVPFHTSRGKRVLEIGCGPGYDAYTFMQHGAEYCGLDLALQNLRRTRKHLALFALSPMLVQADAERLPATAGHFELAYSNGVLHHVPDLGRALREIHEVLEPAADFYLIVYNRFSVFFLLSVLIPHVFTGGFLREPLSARLSRVEYSEADSAPIVRVYSRRELRAALRRAGFRTRSLVVRKCSWRDFPAASKLGALYRLVPRSVYDAVGRLAGWYIIAHSVK